MEQKFLVKVWQIEQGFLLKQMEQRFFSESLADETKNSSETDGRKVFK